jgi:hypothetical protein
MILARRIDPDTVEVWVNKRATVDAIRHEMHLGEPPAGFTGDSYLIMCSESRLELLVNRKLHIIEVTSG